MKMHNDQQMPCCSPRNTLLSTTVSQLGANITQTGINKPSIQPANIGVLRTYKSAIMPTAKLATDFDTPNATTNNKDLNLLSTTKSPAPASACVSTVINA